MNFKKNVLWLTFLINLIAYSQSKDCNCNNSELLELYRIGQFETVKKNINCCLKNTFKGSEKNLSLEILSLTAIAEDSLLIAKKLITDIVLTNQDYDPLTENIIFEKIFEEVRDENMQIRVSSLSKRPEDIKTAPAIVELITSDEIQAAGYNDITEILNNLPGFDISMSKSLLYSNVYQLGLRADSNERTLLMIDGVEENDVYLNWAYISRQYPISNIKAIEVVYGPASTIYGPRAFVGAINIITYKPDEKSRNYFSSKFGKDNGRIRGNISSGSFNTKNIDLTFTNFLKKLNPSEDNKNFNYQITARLFESDENDLTNVPFLDFNTADLNKLEYDHLTTYINSSSTSIASFINNYSGYQNLYDIVGGTIQLSDEGKKLALQYDKDAYQGSINGNPMTPSNASRDYFLEAKLSFRNIIVGYRFWKNVEGWGGWYNDMENAPSKNGANWAPQNKTLFLKYDNKLSEKVSVSVQSSFKNHSLGRETVRVLFKPFGNPGGNLTLIDLIQYDSIQNRYPVYQIGDNIIPQTIPASFLSSAQTSEKFHGWLNRYYFYQATQGRFEGRIYYDTDKFKFMSGLDYRLTSSQGDYLVFYDSNWRGSDFLDNQIDQSYAQEYGTAGGSITSNAIHNPGSNLYSLIDLGVFIQGSYKIGNNFILNSGIRFDKQKQRNSATKGYEVFLPRFGLVYTNNKYLVIKANYSRGFQQPTLWARYSTAGIRVTNPQLQPEGINYLDLSMLGESKNKTFSWNLGVFNYSVFDAIKLESAGNYSRHINVDQYDISGGMFSLKLNSMSKKLRFNLNGNYTSPKTVDSDGNEITLADISQYRLNFGVTSFLNLKKFNASINLRGNFVSSRPVGEDTTVDGNYGLNYSREIPSYFILNSNLILRHKKIPNIYLSLSLNNILDRLYYHPGIRKARAFFDVPDSRNQYSLASGKSDYTSWYNNTAGAENSPYIPQNPRNLLIRLIFDF